VQPARDDPPPHTNTPLFAACACRLYLIQHPLFSTRRVVSGSGPAGPRNLGEPPLPSGARIRPLHGKLELATTILGEGYEDEHYDFEAPERQRLVEHVTSSYEVGPLRAHLAKCYRCANKI